MEQWNISKIKKSLKSGKDYKGLHNTDFYRMYTMLEKLPIDLHLCEFNAEVNPMNSHLSEHVPVVEIVVDGFNKKYKGKADHVFGKDPDGYLSIRFNKEENLSFLNFMVEGK